MSTVIQNQTEAIFNEQDHAIWCFLIENQTKILENKATPAFFENLKAFDLPTQRIPSLQEVSKKMQDATGWQTAPVSGLIGYEQYFTLLKERKFPVAMFIRNNQERGLSKDPDIFHEIFGHCTMLLSPDYANFLHEYANFALTVQKHDRPLYARLMWFTTETALIKNNHTLNIFGSSLISSAIEAPYSLSNKTVIRKPFDIVSIFREPYRADLLQKVYYVLENTHQVYNLLDNIEKLQNAIESARVLGEHPALFPVNANKYTNANVL